jgi:glycosyltransferase involved in cell wall biosynthesis
MKKYPHPGVELALEERSRRCPGRLSKAPIYPMLTLRYQAVADVVVVASQPNHREPYGRLAVEALAMGRPLVCENRGIYPKMLEHGTQALLFDTPDDALNHIEWIRMDKKVARTLAANGQMWASWQDTAVHIGKMRRALRMIGA